MRTPRVRTRARLAAVVGAVLIVASLGVTTALAVHDDGKFELDTSTSSAVCNPIVQPCGNANVADDPNVAGDDWATIYSDPDSSGAFATSFTEDPVSSAENSFYTGGGSKDVRDIPDWAYAETNDVVPDKDDLSHAFAAAYTDSGNPAPKPDHTLVYFGVDRYDNNGDAETGFWFFKDPVTLDGNGGFDGQHQEGDVLVLADWGGSNPVGAFTVYEWVGGKNPLALVSDTAAGQADCAKRANDDMACAVVNRQIVDPPWTFIDKGGSADIRPLELFEAGLDLTALFGEDQCFSSFLASTRSSHSVTAQLKDFVLGQFEQCGAAITIEGDAVNEVGVDHTFTVTVTKSTGAATEPVEGAFPEVTLTDSGGASVNLIADNCADVGTDADGKCTVVFDSATAGIITGHAAVTVTIGDDVFSVETDGEGSNSDDAVKRFVDAYILISPLEDTNEVNDEHDITATVYQDDGLPADSDDPSSDGVDGFGFAPDGTTVDFSLPTNNNNADFTPAGADSCTTTDGVCTVTIVTGDTGDVDIHATTTFDVGGESLTRATDGTGNNSGDANKVYVDAYITIAPDATNPVGEPHTFTVTVKKDIGDGNGFVAAEGEDVDFTLTNGGDAVYELDADASTCDDAGPNTDSAGQCTIVFVSDTPGTVTGHASVTVTIDGVPLARETDGEGNNSEDAVKTYITGAIKILKDSTKGGSVATEGAVFSVSGDLLPADFQVTDNGANDGDPATGVICVGGVTPGSNYTVNEVTPPPGYGEATETDLVAVGISGTCDTAVFGEANTVTFVNAPLFDFQVNFRDGGSGETSATSITCDANDALDDPATDGWDASQTNLDVEFVNENNGEMTIVCTLVVDP